MRLPDFILVGLLCANAVAQSSHCASVIRTEKEVVLSADSWDPVFDIASTLADRYGISVSVESPRWAFPSDTEDVASVDPQFSAQHNNIHYLMIKRHSVQVRFSAPDDAHPTDFPRLLLQIVEAANREMPYAYRLEVLDNNYAFVPTKTRYSRGDLEDVEPLLDYHVSIPAASRPIAEHAQLLAKQLSEQTRLNVSCCQTLVSGVPWGWAEVSFEANDEPAREVLRKLIGLEQQLNSQAPNRHPAYDHWTVTCDGTGAPWCFIDVRGIFSSECQ